jgi:hypothetical protein
LVFPNENIDYNTESKAHIRKYTARRQWLMPVILAIQEAEIRRIAV